MSGDGPATVDAGEVERLTHEMKTALTVVDVSVQLIRRREARGFMIPDWMTIELGNMETAIRSLRKTADALADLPRR